MPVDLSQVLFIATANTTETISPPLLDRCEVIECSGYVVDEKLRIARRFLLPKQAQENGLDNAGIELEDAALMKVITDYTREVSLVVRGPVLTSRRLEYVGSSGSSANSVAPKLSNGQRLETRMRSPNTMPMSPCTTSRGS